MAKRTVESTNQISLTELKKHGAFPATGGNITGSLQWLQNGKPTGEIGFAVNTLAPQPYIQLTYTVTERDVPGPGRAYEYQFPLEKISWRVRAHVVVYQWYILCRLSKKNGPVCGRRTRTLYSMGDFFGCIVCANLTYASCNLSGRNKGFISLPDLERQEAKVKKAYYAGKPTRKYVKLLKMHHNFERQMTATVAWLEGLSAKTKKKGKKR